MRTFIIFLIPTLVFSCSKIEYYTYISEPTENGNILYWEIQLDAKDSIYHEYVYSDQPRIDGIKTIPKYGDVIIGKYSIVEDTLIFSRQNWDFNESDSSFYRSGSMIFNQFLMKDNMLIELGLNSDSLHIPLKEYYKNKSKSFRKEEKNDSIIWMGESQEAIINGIWDGGYPGLDDPKPELDSSNFISPNFIKN